MKICFLTERMRLGYGVDLVVDEQACRLAERGFEVVVVVIHADIFQPPRPYELVVISRIIPHGDFSSEASMRHILSQCRITDVDLWLLHTPPFYDWIRYLDGPVVLIEYGAPPGHFFPPDTGRHIDTMANMRINDLYRELQPCDAIMSISHSIHDWLPPPAQAFSQVIHLGCDHYPRVSTDERQFLRSSLGLMDEHCLILWVGRMQIANDQQPYKGFQELLTLIPFVERQVDQAKFVLVGHVSDHDRSALQSRGITVLANQTPAEMARIYAAADVLINLSRWEGFNLALLEAQFQGTPVVAYNLGPHPEIVRDGETGLLAETPRGFLESVVKIATDHPLRQKLGRQARDFATAFSWNASLDKFEAMVRAAAAKRRHPSQILNLRRRTADRARQAAQVSQTDDKPVTAHALLKLDGIKFVQAARQALLGQAPNEAAEISWLSHLHRGASKQAILLEILRYSGIRGARPNIPGLKTALLPAQIAWLARWITTGQGSGLQIDASPWMIISEDICIQHAYRTLLGREADPQDVRGRAEALRAGVSRPSYLASIRFSDEGRGRPLEDPDLRQILRSYSLSQASSEFPSQPYGFLAKAGEFIDHALRLGRLPAESIWFKATNDEFVRHAHRVLLRREAHPEMVRQLVSELNSGTSRQAILANIRYSAEGRQWDIQDPILRRILLGESLRRLAPISWWLRVWSQDEGAPEGLKRKILRIDSHLRTISADVDRFGAALNSTAQRLGGIETVSAQLNNLESKIASLQTGAFSLPPSAPVVASSLLASPLVAAGRPAQDTGYAFLVAPGTMIDTAALAQLLAVASETGSDIVFGDEYESLTTTSSRRLRVYGPFSHEAFLGAPDLGGVIAVHQDLLTRLGWPATMVLTGSALLQIVALAHSITYVAGSLGERTSGHIAAVRASVNDLRAYVDHINRSALVAEKGDGRFEIRFPAAIPWKAAIIIVAQDEDLGPMLTGLRANTASERFHLTIIRTAQACSQGLDLGTEAWGTSLTIPDGTPYGVVVNEAISRAPADCNLVVVMTAGVTPTAPDWLERLAETALQPATGVVAPKTLYPDQSIRHAGMTVGVGRPCSYIGRFDSTDCSDDKDWPSYLDRLNGLLPLSVVSHHCMVVRRTVLVDQGGFSEDLGWEASDIELCCRFALAGLSVYLDGRVSMVQSATILRWGRDIPPADLAALYRKYHRFLTSEDQFWQPLHRASHANVPLPARTVFLPTIADR